MDINEIDLLQYLQNYLYIVVITAIIIGYACKKTNNIKDNYIIFILLVYCITFSVLLTIINTSYKVTLESIVNGILQGVLCWGLSIGINQSIKQIKKLKEEDK